MVWNKTVEGITKQFDVMIKDLGLIMDDEAKKTDVLTAKMQEIESDISVSLETQRKAGRIQSKIKELVA